MSASMKIIFAILIFALAAIGCTAEAPVAEIEDEIPIKESSIESSIEKESEKEVSYQRITQDEAKAKMTDEAIILDVRMPDEFSAGHIPNAILLPDIEIGNKAADLLPDKDQTILVYCRSGRRSQAAAMALIKMGYTEVYDFGGILDWKGEIEK